LLPGRGPLRLPDSLRGRRLICARRSTGLRGGSRVFGRKRHPGSCDRSGSRRTLPGEGRPRARRRTALRAAESDRNGGDGRSRARTGGGAERRAHGPRNGGRTESARPTEGDMIRVYTWPDVKTAVNPYLRLFYRALEPWQVRAVGRMPLDNEVL